MDRRQFASVTRRTLAFGAALAALAARGQTAAHATRTANDFAQLEEALLRAMRRRDSSQLDKLLADDFEMTVAQLPLDAIGREDWIANLRRPGSTSLAVQALTARELGADFAQVSFWLVPQGSSPARGKVFVVDTWQRDGASWKLLTRHAAPVAGSRLWIPGDSGRAPFRKMI